MKRAPLLASVLVILLACSAPPPPAPLDPAKRLPFDRGAAAATLGSIDAQSCSDEEDLLGSVHIKVVFHPDGHVTSATVDGGPFVGRKTGACVERRFMKAHVPPFAGPPVTVGKSLVLR